jgi:hypothetical protein
MSHFNTLYRDTYHYVSSSRQEHLTTHMDRSNQGEGYTNREPSGGSQPEPAVTDVIYPVGAKAIIRSNH